RLAPAKRALLEQRLAGPGTAAGRGSEIRRRASAGPCVVSFCQQRLWFLDQLAPGSPAYNVPYAMKIEGDLRVEALARALEAVVSRHEVLRTVFGCLKGTPVQVALRRWDPVLRVVDLRGLGADRRGAEVERLLAEESCRPFCLARDLMLRATLLRLTDRESVFLHVTHHIAWDYRSRVVLYRELAHGYEALVAGGSPSM